MDARLWRRVNEILDKVEAVAPEERERLVARECHGDRELEREVWSLVAEKENCPPGFLDTNTGDPMPADRASEVPSAPTLPFVLKDDDLIGDFELLKKVGGGSSGTVYEAVQSRLGRKVALKIVRKDSVVRSNPAADIARMKREAMTAGQLNHPGIATVHDFGQEGDVCWIAMELIRGHDLGREIQWQAGVRLAEADPRLPGVGEPDFISSRVALVRDVALALEAAHGAGIVHRDVKPENIVLTHDGQPKLVDFGLARGPNSPTVTAPDTIAGTVAYMSPEQAAGKPLDARTDVYSLGTVLFQLLTNRLPFPGTNVVSVLRAISHGEVPTLRAADRRFSKDLEAVCAMAMAHERERRYASARAFADDLQRCLEFRSVVARHATPLYRLENWIRRRRRELWVALVAVVAVAILLVVASTSGADRARDEFFHDRVGEAEARLHDYDGGAELATLLPARQALEELADDAEGDRALLLGVLQGQIETAGRRELAGIDELIEEAKGDTDYAPVDERALLRAFRQREVARAVAGEPTNPDDSEFPRVFVSTGRDGDTVRFYPADLLTGDFKKESERVYPTPVEGVALAPGLYRIVVERPGVGFAELTRWLGEWGRTYELTDVPIVPTGDVVKDMVELPAGSQTILLPVLVDGDYPTPSFQHDAFYIDAHEVTNGDYFEFVEAHPGAGYEPMVWKPNPGDREWSERPVAGVSWVQARAYAEWRGKRLPSELEWSRAALGAEGRSFPWGENESLIHQAVVGVGQATTGIDSSETFYEKYLVHTRRVASTPTDVTPEGVHDLAGNLSEWTESMALGEVDGRLYPIVTHRRSKGWNWLSRQPIDLSSYEEDQMSAPSLSFHRGFRCAKSITAGRKE